MMRTANHLKTVRGYLKRLDQLKLHILQGIYRDSREIKK